LLPGEHLLNTAVALNGSGRYWTRYCVLLTDRRLILLGVRNSLLAGWRLIKTHQLVYDTDQIIGCDVDQHWKGDDIILRFPDGELLLRLHFTGQTVAGQRQFWEQVPARFRGRGPSPGEIVEAKLRQAAQQARR
jgi:hypothetical protein